MCGHPCCDGLVHKLGHHTALISAQAEGMAKPIMRICLSHSNSGNSMTGRDSSTMAQALVFAESRITQPSAPTAAQTQLCDGELL